MSQLGYGIPGYIDNLNKQLEQALEESPLPEVEMIEYDPADFELPDSVPVEGWSLEIPFSSGICMSGKTGASILTEYRLVDEVQEWCDENLHSPYWFLGVGLGVGVGTATGPAREGCVLYFTSEKDYIFFKMRWHNG